MNPDTRQDWVWDPQRDKQKRWGLRMKETLQDLSWQHLRDEDIIPDDAKPYPWVVPWVNYVYNDAFGPQGSKLITHLPAPHDVLGY